MGNQKEPYDDEINLLELFLTLWGRKKIVFGSTVCFVCFGFIYSLVSDVKYKVTVPFEIHMYFVNSKQMCGTDIEYIECLESQMEAQIIRNLDNGWVKDRGSDSLSVTTYEPIEEEGYINLFESLSIEITEMLAEEARNEISLVESELNLSGIGNGDIAMHILNAKRILKNIGENQRAVTFKTASVTKIGPKPPMILIISLLIGLGVGVFLALGLDYFDKKRLTKSDSS